MTTEKFLSIMLVLHIAGGTIALISGLVAMLTAKGSKPHRLAGKIYFGGMTAVFIGAVITALGHHKDFLLMIGFFSYYLTVRGYRVLFLKKLNQGQKPVLVDWVIISVSAIFVLALFGWGIWALTLGSGMGITGIVFGAIGSVFLFQDVRNFVSPPKEKMHWWFTHIGSMAGSYISAVTAFVVVNFQLPQYNWVLWVLPTAVGSVLIARTIRKYKNQFNKTGVVS
ncbi:MAG: hypothetical protein ACKVOQ_18770 [Cyclobacteriaceae bacterium]